LVDLGHIARGTGKANATPLLEQLGVLPTLGSNALAAYILHGMMEESSNHTSLAMLPGGTKRRASPGALAVRTGSFA
jgi:hypothetical protein